ncbi:hypothetical protein OAP63_10155 [Vibrio sp.]|uniref:Uncharacterized protein n=1 Tax=Vibrio viridaestus TaxID=2487322 RepID=A0A3N9TIL3_9VIBR|nr:hypothetical protein [Vibrio viridaestus]MDC0611092.1 hypothetical protein [Vibrio sp.]RQW64059.1 hypothetical protein EES38_05570 [Vibrio viridaestus]
MKLLGKVIVTLGVFPLFANADAETLSQSFNALNTQTSLCMEYKKRTVNTDDQWLLDLTENQLKVALLELNAKAMEKCTLKQRESYSYQLVIDAAESGDLTKLHQWVKLNSPQKNDDYNSIFKDVPSKQLSRVSHLPEFKYPFDTLKSLQAIQAK